MQFIKYLVSPFAAFIMVLFVLSNWIIIIIPSSGYTIDMSGLRLIIHSLETGASGGYVILVMVFFAGCIFLVSLIPKVNLRKILIVFFSVLAICTLLYFAIMGGDPTRTREEINLGIGWFVCFIAAIVAIVGAFLPKDKTQEEVSTSLNIT